MGTINCIYETPCGWCTKWDKKCDKKIKDNKFLQTTIMTDNPPPPIKTTIMTDNQATRKGVN